MIAYFVLGLALLLGFGLLARWFIDADPKSVARVFRWLLPTIGIVVVLALVFFARQFLLAFLLPFLILLLRNRGLLQYLKSFGGPTPGRTSSVETRFLRMTLDHDSGNMTGVIKEGPFRGAGLDQLNLEQLMELWRDCRAQDEQSAAVLEAYLDRAHPDDWRERVHPGEDHGPAPGAARGPMTRDEAFEILGLDRGASPEEIRDAHRRLMQKVHPDKGGSNFLAAKINEAKTLLLNE